MEDYLSPLIVAASKGLIKRVDITNKTLAPKGVWTSAYPMEVIWDGANYGSDPVSKLGGYGGKPDSPIGKIWFNCDFVKETWRKFFNENSKGDAVEKGLRNFLNTLCSRANEACGDFWQLSSTVVEKISTCGGVGTKVSVLAVEDFSYCAMVSSFPFNASFGKPMLKNVSISMQGASGMGASVMGGGNLDTPGAPKVTHGTDPQNAIIELKKTDTRAGAAALVPARGAVRHPGR